MGTYLSRTFSGANTSRKTFTLSFWVKRSKFGSVVCPISAETNNDDYDQVIFTSSNQLDINNVASASDVISFKTTAVFRDPSAWYHIVCAIDTTQASFSNGIKIYVNGVLQTSFGVSTYAQDATFEIGRDGSTTSIGRRQRDTDMYGVGYLAEFYYIDGQQKAATDFGETDSTTGIWKPKTYSGTYGNNGFRLEFKNSGALGTDTSGNAETFTVNNAGTGAQVTDTPSNVFSVLNTITADGGTWSLGALRYLTNGTDLVCGISSFALTGSSKWYCEMKAITKTGNYFNFGVASSSKSMNDNGIIYRSDGKIYKDGNENQGSLATFTDNDIIGIIYDCNNNQCSFQKNGSAVGSAVTIGDATKDIFFVTGGNGGTNATAEVNFGNPVFSISSSNADGAGLGSFEYAVPSGAYSLCTENLNTYG